MLGEATEPVLGIRVSRLLFRLDRGRQRGELAVALGHRVPARVPDRGATQRAADGPSVQPAPQGHRRSHLRQCWWGVL